MPEIDYKKYLEGLGAVTTKQVDRIKEYLEKQCESDEALKAAYVPEKIVDCYDFIENAVKNMARQGNCACLEDPVVYKMARDYFIEILPNLVDVTSIPETAEEVAKQIEKDAKADNVKRTELGFEIFGEESEEPEESEEEETAEEPCNQDDVGEEEKVLQPVAGDTPKYDENGCGLLFDFD